MHAILGRRGTCFLCENTLGIVWEHMILATECVYDELIPLMDARCPLTSENLEKIKKWKQEQ